MTRRAFTLVERPALSRRKRAAFTLVELLAATALSALLMTAGFGVLRSIGRPVATSANVDAWRAPLAGLIRADVTHALAVRPDADGVTLAGLNAIDPATALPLHRPATVAYRVATIGGTRWLVREQASLDRESPASVDLVCANVARVRAVLPPVARSKSRDDAAATLAGDATLPQLFRRLAGFRRAPEHWQLVVDFEGRPSLAIAGSS